MFGRFPIADAISARGLARVAPSLVTTAKKTGTTTTA
jgi:hypothetical protein